MTLRLNGGGPEILETISYIAEPADSGDLEAATKTISAVAEPGEADYTVNLTITASPDSRLVAQRVCTRLLVTIDSFGGGGAVLNYRIKRNGVSIGTGTLSTGASTGQKIVANDITTGLSLGSSLAYDVYLWVDVGTCVVSLCQIQANVGASGSAAKHIWTLTYMGRMAVYTSPTIKGTGSPTVTVSQTNIESSGENLARVSQIAGNGASGAANSVYVGPTTWISLKNSTTTDLNYLYLTIKLLREIS